MSTRVSVREGDVRGDLQPPLASREGDVTGLDGEATDLPIEMGKRIPSTKLAMHKKDLSLGGMHGDKLVHISVHKDSLERGSVH